jgi:hypothetical protein
MRKSVFFTIGILTVLLTVAAGFASCDQTSATAGRLIVNITDAPSAPNIDQVWLTITGVQVHVAGAGDTEEEPENGNGGEWKDLPLVGAVNDEVRFDLLELVNGSQEKVAVGFLDPGKYTQLRMDVELVQLHFLNEGTTVFHEAKLPSDVLKFVHPFEIVKGGDTELLFDFDALKSVVVTGKDTYIFKPVVKVTTINQPFQITTPSLFNGAVDANYITPTLTAIGGVGSYAWSLATGSALPTNLTIDAAGNITGIPTTAGVYTFTIKVVDSSPSPLTATKSFSIDIAASGTLQITTTYIPDGTEGGVYIGATLVAIDGTGYLWELASASVLPPGLSLSNAGVITGTPTAKGDYSFTVKVTDTGDTTKTDTQVITISIK